MKLILTSVLALAAAMPVQTTQSAPLQPASSQSARDATASTPGVDLWSSPALVAQARTLHELASKSPGGSASYTLTTYPGHHTMLTVRTLSGGGELHRHAADIFIVLDGDATEYTGGTLVGAHEQSPGELRGSAVTGGTPHPLHKGDILHIAPDTPHQTVLAPGATFTYFVIKVDQP